MSTNGPLLLRIDRWEETFERAGTRAVERCGWLCTPNKADSMGLAALLEEPDGRALYGVYQLVAQRCSRQLRPNSKKTADMMGKADRAGWLTDNGLETGKPWNLDSLAKSLRTPLYEMLRMVTVCSRPDVGWIKIVSGSQEFEVEWNGTTKKMTICPASDAPPSPEHRSTIAPPSPEIVRAKPSVDITDRTERREVPPIIPRDGGSAEATPRTAAAEQSPPSPEQSPPSPEHRPSDDAETLHIAEAKSRLNKIFGRKKGWSYDEDHLLSDLCPISEEDMQLIEWGYSLPTDTEGWALCRDRRVTKPKQTMIQLLREFSSELDKWMSVKKQLGMNGTKPLVLPDEWPPHGKEKARELWGEAVALPDRFSQLGTTACEEITEALNGQ